VIDKTYRAGVTPYHERDILFVEGWRLKKYVLKMQRDMVAIN
jgi:hypothetical protein